MKIKGTPGTIKIGEIEVATVESLEMKTPGFTEPEDCYRGRYDGLWKFSEPVKAGDMVYFQNDKQRLRAIVRSANSKGEAMSIEYIGKPEDLW